MNSSLQKGLIFRASLSEWNPTRDEVSGVVGTPTAVYNVLGKGGEGRRYLENINTSYSTIPDAAQYDFGTADFTLITSFTPANITDNGKYLISKEAGGIGYGIYQEDNDIWIRCDDNTTDVSAIIGTDILVAGTKITCEVVFTRAGNAELYVNGSSSSSGTVAISTASLTLDNTGAFVVGNIEAHNQGFTGQIHFTRAFNFALTTDMAYYSKPENPIKATHIGSGATKNVLNLNAEGLAQSTSGYWYDKTNSLTATNSGTTLIIPAASNLSAMAFNGTSSKIITTIPNLLLGDPDFTMSAWICPLSFSGLQMISTYGASAAAGAAYIYLDTNGKLNFGYVTNGVAYLSNSTISINTYNQVLATYKNRVVTFYINGVQNGSVTIANDLNILNGSVYTGVFVDGASYPFNGLISDISIWNRILSADEVKLVYDTGF